MGNDDHPPSFILSLEPDSLESAIAKKELQNEQKCMITVEIVLGMRYIHSHNFMHRNLKPSNVLLNESKQVKICDFGISHSKRVGTLRFKSPELFIDDDNEEDDDTRTHYTSMIDVYSFGIVLIYIMTGSYPKFDINKVFSGAIPLLPDTIAKWARELIVRCLSLSIQN